MKRLIIISAIIIIIPLFSIYGYAEEKYENNIDSIISEYRESIFDTLDEETKNILDDFGLNEPEAQKLINLSFKDILSVIKESFTFHMNEYISSFSKMLGLLIVLIIINSIRDKSENDIIDDIFLMISVLILSVFLTDIVRMLVSVFTITSRFMAALIPIMTVILSFCGNITFSAAYSTVMVGFCQVLSFISENVIIPFTGIYFGIVISMNLNEVTDSNKICHGVNRFVTSALGVISTLFTLMLSAKNLLAKDVDGVLYNSGKYLISSFVPVVGGAVSSILSSVLGSLSLVKSTIGIFAVIAALCINVPLFVKTALCRVSLGLMSLISDFFGEKRTCSLISNLSESVKFLSVLAFFEMITVLISTGLAVSVRSNLQ